MQDNILGTSLVAQVGILVHDIETASEKFAQLLGVKKPDYIVTDAYEKAKTEYKGKPTKARAKLAFFKVGPNLDIELIEPDHEPSTWREALDEKGEGVHHLAFVIRDMDKKIQALEEANCPLIQKGDYTGGRYAYLDTFRDLKIIVELLENVG